LQCAAAAALARARIVVYQRRRPVSSLFKCRNDGKYITIFKGKTI
jgi:hypothetical protein